MLRQIAEISRNFITFRHLLAHMIFKEVKSRFAGSSVGLLWNFIHPLVMLLIFLFVFVYIFKLRLPDQGGTHNASIYLMSGLFPWMALSEGLMRSTNSLIENAEIIKKSYFPTEILPAKAVVAAFSSHGVAIVILAGYVIATKQSYGILLYLPLVIAAQALFTLGVGFIFSCLTVFVRDTVQILNLVIGFWVYVTPILYPLSMLPEWARSAMYGNPVFPFVQIYQSLFLKGEIGDHTMMLMAVAWAVFAYSVGAYVFAKLKGEFADWL
ncbi:MAG TPA: ABC transporter permease [Dissulfurispiraceae bacterium]|nr:ABC transporter permease [Dissulfurispiraceae bacterium]